MAVSGGATALITALNSQKTVKSTLNLKKSIDGLNKAQESGGLENFKDITQNILMGGPASSALAVFSANLKSKTAESSVRLLKELIELLGSDLGQAGIGALAGLINEITEKAETIAGLLNLVSDTPLEGTFDVLSKISEVIRTLLNPIELMTDALKIFTAAIEFFKDTTSSANEKLKTFLENAGLFGDVLQWIIDFIEKITITAGPRPDPSQGFWVRGPGNRLIWIPPIETASIPPPDYSIGGGGGQYTEDGF